MVVEGIATYPCAASCAKMSWSPMPSPPRPRGESRAASAKSSDMRFDRCSGFRPGGRPATRPVRMRGLTGTGFSCGKGASASFHSRPCGGICWRRGDGSRKRPPGGMSCKRGALVLWCMNICCRSALSAVRLERRVNDTHKKSCSQSERRSTHSAPGAAMSVEGGRGATDRLSRTDRRSVRGPDLSDRGHLKHAMADSVKHVFVTGGNAGSTRPCLPLRFARYLWPTARLTHMMSHDRLSSPQLVRRCASFS